MEDPPKMEMRLEQRPEQRTEMLPLAKQELAHSYLQLVIVNAVVRRVRELLIADKSLACYTQNPDHFRGLTGHIVRRVLIEVGSELARVEYEEEHPEDLQSGIVSVVESTASKVNGVFARWRRDADLWYVPSVIEKDRVSSRVRGYVELAEEDFPTATLPLFHRVRTAAFDVMKAEDLEGFEAGYDKSKGLPQTIEESYSVPFLRPDHLQLLFDPEDGGRRFRQRTNKGVFVFNYRERQRSADGYFDEPSVFESMRDALKHPPNSAQLGRYEGRILRDDEGGILAWHTYVQTPPSPSTRHVRSVETYLSRGATKAKMKYHGTPPLDEFMAVAKQIQLFDTVVGHHRYAVDRDLALSFRQMRNNNPNIKYIIPFRLKELHVTPAIPGMRGDEPVRFADNLSSATLFEKRGFREFATDHNFSGPRSRRVVHVPNRGEMELLLNPEWVALYANMQEAVEASIREWQNIKVLHGDISFDDGSRWRLPR